MTSAPVVDTASDTRFFGHPRGLSTLFFTEMWERFSYYGMRALLILFMVAPPARGGLGFTDSKAGAIYGLYTACVFLASLPGGWIADRILGQRKSVLYGGMVIAAGHFCMALPRLDTFYFGLFLIVIGTGMLKPNVSTMVGQLYARDDVRRDAGFSIFYMGINLGAMISPLVCGYLGERVNWHYGFGAAGVGMTFGVVQYMLGARNLGSAGLVAGGKDARSSKILFQSIAVAASLALLVGGAIGFGLFEISAETLSNSFGVALTAVVVIFFVWLLTSRGWTPEERKRLWAILVLFIAAALFWSAFEQAGSTLNLFAERATRLNVIGYDFPASWFQSMNSFFILALAPVFAAIWVRLGKRNPTSTAKFSVGLVFVGLGFAILVPIAGMKNVSPMWLTLTYFFHTIGELCISPVGLSAMTKLAPVRVGALMMGVWFLANSVGDYIGGRLASVYQSFPLPVLFGTVAAFSIAVGLVLFLLIPSMKRLMGGVK